MRSSIRSLCRLFLLLAVSLLTSSARAEPELRFAEIGDLKLESGQVIKNCRIGYRVYGVLNPDKANAVLFPTWFGGTSADLDPYIGQSRMLDSAGLFVVTVDALGNGVSSSPSNSKEQPGTQFPAYSIRDMVESQYRLLKEILKVEHLKAVIGISMGGMQTFEWMVSHPTFMDRAISLVGTPKQTAQDLLLWKSQLRTIVEHRGAPEEVRRGMKAVARIHALSLRTPAFNAAHAKPESVDAQMDTQEENILGKNAEDWASQLGAMIAHDIYKPFAISEEKVEKTIRAKALIVVVTSDQMVNPTPARRFAERTGSRLLALENNGGHLGLSLEMDRVTTAVREFVYSAK